MALVCPLHSSPCMNKGIYPVLSGGIAQERRLDILTNNLANMNTSGFKKDAPVFSVEVPADNEASLGLNATVDLTGEQSFVGIAESFTDMSPGPIHQSGNTLDFSIEGTGFFVVDAPDGTRFTRNGSFTLGSDRQLMTQDGYPVQGENGTIQIAGDGAISVDSEGHVSVNGSEVNRFRVVTFDNPENLKKVSSSLFQGDGETPSTDFKVLQGTLEAANVGGLKEMTSMIEVMRAYESYQKAMRSLDELSEKANEVGRIF